jgi:hypothetical protein
MSLTDLDDLSTRIRQLVTDAVEYAKPRHLILAEFEDLADELLDERDNMIAQLEQELCDDRLFLSSI